jgi:hypothetical protein
MIPGSVEVGMGAAPGYNRATASRLNLVCPVDVKSRPSRRENDQLTTVAKIPRDISISLATSRQSSLSNRERQSSTGDIGESLRAMGEKSLR